MNAPLLLALRDELVTEGWGVLRFNFRGIGASEGESSDGIAEVADAQGALASARERWPGVPIAIGGWSFGAAVALRVVEADDSLAACAVIAPAILPKPGITAGAPSADEIDLGVRTLLVCGANDDLVSPADARAWAETAGATYVEVPAANHFFWAKYDKLTAIVSDWLNEVVPV